MDAFNWLTQGVKSEVSVEVITRWQMADLIVGASDLSVYEACREKGWRFGVCQNFHGKTYVIDDREAYLGSANLTQRGMCIGAVGNIEFGARLEFDIEDVGKLKQVLSQNVVWINDDIYQKLCEEVSTVESNIDHFPHASWSSNLALGILVRMISDSGLS